MMKSINFLLVILLLSSCNIINPDEQEPTYVSIDKINLSAGNAQGGNTEKITDAWVYVNSQLIGAFQMPTTFPVLGEGEVVVEVFPGIKVNGIAEVPDIYPFYERDSITVDLQGGTELVLTPGVQYISTADFVLIEQFNEVDQQLNFDADNNPATKIEIVTGESSLDGSSGHIHLDTATVDFFDIGSVRLESVPTASRTFYLEMDYKTDIPMFIGLVAYDIFNVVIGSNFNQGVLAKSSWNKIYLDLSEAISDAKNLPTFSYYLLHFTAAIVTPNEENITEADIYWDNVKLIKFE
jgi:hypothetical protein